MKGIVKTFLVFSLTCHIREDVIYTILSILRRYNIHNFSSTTTMIKILFRVPEILVSRNQNLKSRNLFHRVGDSRSQRRRYFVLTTLLISSAFFRPWNLGNTLKRVQQKSRSTFRI